MTEERISLNEALDYLVSTGSSVDQAKDDLLSALESETVQAVASEAVIGNPKKPDYYWLDVLLRAESWGEMRKEICFASSELDSVRLVTICNGDGTIAGCTLENLRATGIRVFRSQLEREFPKETVPGERPKSSGGRPPSHDWGGAFFHAGAKFRGELPETKDQVSKLVQAWFDAHYPGSGPDEREIRRRVSKMYVR